MGWLIFFGILLLILGILMIPVHAIAEYKEDFILDIKFLLFFKKRIIPFSKKEKTPEEKTEKKTKTEKNTKEKKPKRKYTPEEIVDMIIYIVDKYGPGAKMILRNIRFHRLELYWKVCGEDAANCGIKYGRVCAWFSSVLAFFRNLVKIEHPKFKIFPDFLGEKDEIYGGFDLECNPLVVLIGALRMGFVFIKELIKKLAKNKKAQRQNIKAKESIRK